MSLLPESAILVALPFALLVAMPGPYSAIALLIGATLAAFIEHKRDIDKKSIEKLRSELKELKSEVEMIRLGHQIQGMR